jgi:hypothetical protein
MTQTQDSHTPVLPPLIPKDPTVEMLCRTCQVPRLFATCHFSPPPQPNAIPCMICHEPTWLLCTTCNHPYQPGGQ